ncbi:MAG TPA: BamA/TamA family outer membrane protein [Ideonella sp.]|nr:BamA/TamA family outer membrane protein [Ideonella sp.]
MLGLLSGCSTLRGWFDDEPDKGKAAAAAASEPASAPVSTRTPEEEAAARAALPRLEVDAAKPLKALLETYLDLPRAVALPDATSVSRAEWSRLIAATPAQARQLVQTEGHFDAEASVTQEPGDVWTVRLALTPGRQARIGKLTVEVQGELAELIENNDAAAKAVRSEVEDNWSLKVGEPFRNEAWSGAKNALMARLRAEGYAAASWSGTAAEVDAQTQQVRLFVVADSGPLYRAGPIQVEGTVVHEAARVRALAGFSTGAPMTETRLLDYQERLVKTGLFDQVTVLLDPDPALAATAPIHVRVKESKLQTATVAVGVSADTGPRITLEHTHRRVFGWAATARNKFEYGRDKQAWDGEIATHPDADFNSDLVGGAVERLLTDTDLVLSQRLRVGRSQDTPRQETLRFVEGERARECSRLDTLISDCVDLRALSINQYNTWRRLDNPILPTAGYTLQLQGGVGVADGSESKRGGFARLYGRAIGYWPLGDAWYSQARLELGGVITQSGVQVPDSLRFRAGGDESVRGYEYRTLAPVRDDGSYTGGKLLFTTSVELARPISPKLPSVWWATFIDAGRAADSVKELDPALGYGVGVRWRSPVGPLRLDWAWGQEVHASRIHLSVGIAF